MRFIFLGMVVFSCFCVQAQNVAVNNSGAVADPKAMLDISSNSKGVLIPRMTQVERDAITGPPNGLMIYNTSTNSFQYYNSAVWNNITHSGIATGTPNKVPRFLGIWGLTPGLMTDDANGVSINNTSAVASASAILDISSSNKGLLMPRMTTLQRNAIAAPANGLLVYDTDMSALMFYNGSVWGGVNGNGAGEWNISGNNIYNNNTGNVGIGTSAPQARLAVDSSIMLDADNSNDGTLNRSALLFGNDKKVGIMRSWVNGSNFRSGLAFSTSNIRRMLIDSIGRVGINTTSPQQILHVSGNTYIGGNLGIGSTTPDYAFDNQWGYNYMYYSLGIGPGITPSSTWMLDVGGGDARFRQDVTVQGSTTITGTLTTNNGKGTIYNGASATNLRMTPFTTANFHAVLGPHGSAETTIGLPGGFTTTPRVFVGSIRSTGGTAGELNRVILVLWGCDTNSCNAKIINTDNASVDYNITWDCLAIGN
jgi:hypothetical protein